MSAGSISHVALQPQGALVEARPILLLYLRNRRPVFLSRFSVGALLHLDKHIAGVSVGLKLRDFTTIIEIGRPPRVTCPILRKRPPGPPTLPL